MSLIKDYHSITKSRLNKLSTLTYLFVLYHFAIKNDTVPFCLLLCSEESSRKKAKGPLMGESNKRKCFCRGLFLSSFLFATYAILTAVWEWVGLWIGYRRKSMDSKHFFFFFLSLSSCMQKSQKENKLLISSPLFLPKASHPCSSDSLLNPYLFWDGKQNMTARKNEPLATPPHLKCKT